MTCVWDSLLNGINTTCKTSLHSINDLKLHIQNEFKLPLQVKCNDCGLSVKQQEETLESIRNLTIRHDGYDISAFEPLFLAACQVFNICIEHTMRIHGNESVLIKYTCDNTMCTLRFNSDIGHMVFSGKA